MELDTLWSGRCKSIETMGSQHHMVLVGQNREPLEGKIGSFVLLAQRRMSQARLQGARLPRKIDNRLQKMIKDNSP